MSLHFISITSSALALHCCNAHAKINRKIENSTPCKIVTHEDFNFKLGTRDYVADITHHTTLGSNRPSGGFPPNRGNITAMWLFWLYCFFSRSCPQVEPSHWLLRRMAQMTCFRPRTVLLGVWTMGDVRRRSSLVQFTAGNWTKLNRAVQFSWVQFSAVNWA